uniref:Uncharacterized protein n=1 Tax=Physcomitrium patens TaxID=3218 RepID=A0A2K1J7E7_PHYPA|nr:hypothetical protein PHYPA_020556 [Physcomitrium patens]
MDCRASVHMLGIRVIGGLVSVRHEGCAIVLINFFADGSIRLAFLYAIFFCLFERYPLIDVGAFALSMPPLSTFSTFCFLFEFCDPSRSSLLLFGREGSLSLIRSLTLSSAHEKGLLFVFVYALLNLVSGFFLEQA